MKKDEAKERVHVWSPSVADEVLLQVPLSNYVAVYKALMEHGGCITPRLVNWINNYSVIKSDEALSQECPALQCICCVSSLYPCVRSGDFFKDTLPEADLYVLARILHDWTDERCIELLNRVYGACKPGLSVCVCVWRGVLKKIVLFFFPSFLFPLLLQMRWQIISHNAADPSKICPSDFDQR